MFDKSSQRYKLSKIYRQSMLKQLNQGKDPKRKVKKTSATMKPGKKAAKERLIKKKDAKKRQQESRSGGSKRRSKKTSE